MSVLNLLQDMICPKKLYCQDICGHIMMQMCHGVQNKKVQKGKFFVLKFIIQEQLYGVVKMPIEPVSHSSSGIFLSPLTFCRKNSKLRAWG